MDKKEKANEAHSFIHLHATTMAKIKIDNIDIVEDKEQEECIHCYENKNNYFVKLFEIINYNWTLSPRKFTSKY